MNEHEHFHTERDGHLTVYLAWPLLAGFFLGLVLACCAGGLVGIWKWNIVAGLKTAGIIFFVIWATGTLGTFIYAAASWGGPLAIKRLEQPMQVINRVDEPVRDERPPMVIRGYNQPPMIEASLENNIKALEPDATKEVRELYKFITTMWPTGSITQADCLGKGFSRRDWDRYIGGSRRKNDAGKDSARGWLDRAGVISKEGNEWKIAASLEEALSINDDLLRYATSLSKVVRLK